MTVTLSRLYADDASANAAIHALCAAGLAPEGIGLMSAVRARAPDDAPADAHRAGVGTVAGKAASRLADFGLLVLPGVRPVVAAGWLAAMIAAALVEGTAGDISAALALAGVGRQAASGFLSNLRKGLALVSIRVPAQDRARYEAILASPA